MTLNAFDIMLEIVDQFIELHDVLQKPVLVDCKFTKCKKELIIVQKNVAKQHHKSLTEYKKKITEGKEVAKLVQNLITNKTRKNKKSVKKGNKL